MHELRDEDPAQLAIRVLQLDSQLSEERVRSHQLQSALTTEQIALRECRNRLEASSDEVRQLQRQVQAKDAEVQRLVAQLQDAVLSNRRENDLRNEQSITSSGIYRNPSDYLKRAKGDDRWVQCDLISSINQDRENELAALAEENDSLRQRIAELETSAADDGRAEENRDDYTEDSGDLNGDDQSDDAQYFRPEPPKFKLNFHLPPAVQAGDEDLQNSIPGIVEETPRIGVCLRVNQQINLHSMLNTVSQRQLTAREYNTKHPMQTPRALPTPRASGGIRIPFLAGSTFAAGGGGNADSESVVGSYVNQRSAAADSKKNSDLELVAQPSGPRKDSLAEANATNTTEVPRSSAGPDHLDDDNDGSDMCTRNLLLRRGTAQPSDFEIREPPKPRDDDLIPVQAQRDDAHCPAEPPVVVVGQAVEVVEGGIAQEEVSAPHLQVSPPENADDPTQRSSRLSLSANSRPNHNQAASSARHSLHVAQPRADSPEPASPDLDMVKLRFMDEGSIEGSPRSLFSIEREVDASRCLVCELIDHIQFTYSGKMKSRAAYYAVGWFPEICQRWQLEHSLVWTIEERATVATTLQNRPTLSSFSHWHYEGNVKVKRDVGSKFWKSPWQDSYALLQGIFLYVFDAKAPQQRVTSVISVRGAVIELVSNDPKAPYCLRISALGCRTCAGASETDGVDELLLRFDSAAALTACRQAVCTMQMTCPHQCSAKFAQEVESFKEIAELLLSMSVREEREHKRTDSKRKSRQVREVQ